MRPGTFAKKKYYLHRYLDRDVYNYISFYESGTFRLFYPLENQ